jgi:hypothetical protein
MMLRISKIIFYSDVKRLKINVCMNNNIWGNAQQFEIRDKDSETEFCQEYKYLEVIFDTSGTDDKEIT